MKYCSNCKIKINTRESICPLCQNKLTGTCESIYPELISKKKNIATKLVSFIALASLFISLYIDLLINHKITWSLFIILSIITSYSIFYYLMHSYHKEFYKLFNTLLIVILLLLFLWYFFTGLSFITDFIIPILCIIILAFTSIYGILLKDNFIKRYMHIILLNFLISLIPIILSIFNMLTIKWPCYILYGISIIDVIGLIVFDYSDIKDELIKIFNI